MQNIPSSYREYEAFRFEKYFRPVLYGICESVHENLKLNGSVFIKDNTVYWRIGERRWFSATVVYYLKQKWIVLQMDTVNKSMTSCEMIYLKTDTPPDIVAKISNDWEGKDKYKEY